MTAINQDLLNQFSVLNIPVSQSVSMSSLLAYQIGGPADFLVRPNSVDQTVQTLSVLKTSGVLPLIVGNGTNLLVRDGGLRGWVLDLGARYEFDDCSMQIQKEDEDSVWIEVPAWESKSRLLQTAIQNQWSGLEFSAGIPGSLGGAVFMNAGTRWGSYSEVIQCVTLWKTEEGLTTKSVEEMGFQYRGHGHNVITSGTAVLSVNLKLKKHKSKSAIVSTVDEILEYRGTRQPLDNPSCGSVFKNPESSERGAGRLIEAAGLKGLRIGGAQVSEQHANFILNLGGASSRDVEMLIERIQESVEKKFSIKLELELVVLGEN
jgi:UDP-N-acetylmuramate dehydrogenase